MKKGMATILSLVMAFCLMVCGGGQYASAAGNPGAEPLVLRLGAEADLKSSYEATTLYSAPLVGLDASANAVPWLVKRWGINGDATEYTLYLRENVMFSDGTPFTAEICKYDIEAVGAVYYCSYLSILDTIEVLDDTTLKVKFTQSKSVSCRISSKSSRYLLAPSMKMAPSQISSVPAPSS